MSLPGKPFVVAETTESFFMAINIVEPRKETPRRIKTVKSSLNEISSDHLGNSGCEGANKTVGCMCEPIKK